MVEGLVSRTRVYAFKVGDMSEVINKGVIGYLEDEISSQKLYEAINKPITSSQHTIHKNAPEQFSDIKQA